MHTSTLQGVSTAKYATYARVLESRIRQGDYAVRGLPTEQELAHEIGVSRTTARRALLQLMDKGLLVRKPHGKISLNHEHAQFAGRLRLAFLSPAFSSPDFDNWRHAVERAAVHRKADVRVVDFVHWNDSVIPQTLAGFDGVFLVPSSEIMPPDVIARFSQANNLIMLDGDLSGYGVPSVNLLPPIFVHKLCDHLYELGHRHIHCLNTQPRDEVISKRIEQWELWRRVHKVEGRLIDEPVKPFDYHLPKAYEVMKRLLDRGDFNATAIICITDVMTGVHRALHEHGLQMGRDISVCAVNSPVDARYFVPSRTVLEAPNAEPYIEFCLEWLSRRGAEWVGPHLIQPASVALYVGESTGPVRNPALAID